MRVLRLLFLTPFLLTCAPALRASIVYGTSNTTPLSFDTTSDPFSHGNEAAIEFTVPSGENFVLTGFAAPLGNEFRASAESVTFSVTTAVPRVPATTPATQQPGTVLDSVTFSLPSSSTISVFTEAFSGGATLVGGTTYFLLAVENTTGGTTQVDWDEALSGSQTVDSKQGTQPWVSVTGFLNPAFQILGTQTVPEPSTRMLAAIGLALIAIYRYRTLVSV